MDGHRQRTPTYIHCSGAYSVIVLDLSCDHSHRFEAWFASAAAFEEQYSQGRLSCPVCASTEVRRLPSAPHVRTRASAPPAQDAPAQPPGRPAHSPPTAPLDRLMAALRHMARGAEDVGERLPEEARRIHYGEAEPRNIRGAASRDEVEELLDEGIAVMPVPPDENLH